MKKFLSAVAVSALMLSAPNVLAADLDPVTGMPFYVSVFGGGSWLDKTSANYATNPAYSLFIKSKPGYLLGGAVGVELTDIIRAEIELSHSNSKVKSAGFSYAGASVAVPGATGKTKATYLMGNLWADYKNESILTPYIGGGAGIGWADSKLNGLDFLDDSGLAFQVGTGVKVGVYENVSLDVGYRFKGIMDVKVEQPTGFKDTDVYSHNVQVGLTLKF